MRYALMVDSPTVFEQNKITRFLQDQNDMGYWHHFAHSWLIYDNSGASLEEFRNLICNLIPGRQFLLIPVDNPYNWAAWGAQGDFEWFDDEWVNATRGLLGHS